MYAFQLHKHRRKISLFFRLCSSFFRNRIFLLSGFTRNHFMTGVDSHNHTEKRAASKIFVSRFHVFIAGIKGSDHGCECSKWPIFMCFHLNIPPAFFYIIPLFGKYENRKFMVLPVQMRKICIMKCWLTMCIILKKMRKGGGNV